MGKRAVIVVDLQNEYLPSGQLPLHRLKSAVDNAARVIAAARAQAWPVFHIRHEQPDAPYFVPGSAGVAIIDDVAPTEGETIIVKNYPSAFRHTNLESLLRTAKIEEVVIAGAMSHMCIAATGRAASDLGFATIVVHDACATMDLEHDGVIVPADQVHAANMAALAFAYARTVTADALLSE